MKIAFRANGGGAGIGFGHLMRCIAVADALSKKGAKPWFVSKDYPAGVKLVQERGYEVRTIPCALTGNEDLAASLKLLQGADIIVADSYEFDANYLRGLSADAGLVASFSDLPDRELPVDAVIGNAYASRAQYGAKLPGSAKLIAGPNYLPLRREFQNQPVRAYKDGIGRVLITMGGEDAVNATQKVVEALAGYKRPVTMDILLGAAYKHREQLERALKNHPQKHAIHVQLKDVLPLYRQADVAITAPGVSLWELAATGMPMAIIQTADNQNDIVPYAQERRLGVVLGWHNRLKPQDIVNALVSLENAQVRREYGLRCQQLVDGKGAERIADELLRVCQHKQTEVSA